MFDTFLSLSIIFLALGGVFNNWTLREQQKTIVRLQAQTNLVVKAAKEMSKAVEEMLDEFAKTRSSKPSTDKQVSQQENRV